MKNAIVFLVIATVVLVLTPSMIFAEGGPTPRVSGSYQFLWPHSGEPYVTHHEIIAFDGSLVGGEDWGKWKVIDPDKTYVDMEIVNIESISEQDVFVVGVVKTNKDGLALGTNVSVMLHDGGPGRENDWAISPDYPIVQENIVIKTFGLIE